MNVQDLDKTRVIIFAQVKKIISVDYNIKLRSYSKLYILSKQLLSKTLS